jgi:GAF domain-containing protein
MTETALLTEQLRSLIDGENNQITILANACALLNDTLADINWAGFYIYNEGTNELDLGPFQGKVACMHIKPGRGVCGTAFATQQTQRVADVHQFPGHIACDSASNSELVIPLGRFGVLDIDSPKHDRFSAIEQSRLEEFTSALCDHLDAAPSYPVQ